MYLKEDKLIYLYIRWNMKNKLIIIAVLIFVLIAAAIISTILINPDQVLFLNANNTSAPTATQNTTPTIAPTSEPTQEPTATPEPIPQYTNIVVGMTGDMIAHEMLLDNNLTWDNGTRIYSFDSVFEYVKPALEYPDLMIANLESPIAGKSAGYTQTGTLTFNFPDQIAEAIKNSGIDMVLNGNNHACDKNVEGLYRTLDILDEADVMHTGAWRSPEERAMPTVVEIQGIKIGIVSATYSLNGRESYMSDYILDYLVCFIDEAQVKEQIDLCRENGAEIVIVTPHMGDEYEQYTREYFRTYARNYIALGADIVVAHHPHVLQGTELLQATAADGTVREGVVFYSLGNFVSNQGTLLNKGDFAREVRETGIILYINIQKDNYTGEVKIESLEYLPIWMLIRRDLNPRIYASLPAGDGIDFTAAPYDNLPLSESNFASLDRAWALALSQVGTEYATPLSTLPESKKDDDELQEN